MTWNLATYTLPQLKQLSARLSKAIAKQEAAAKTATFKKLERMAREHRLSLNDVLGDAAQERLPKVPRTPSPAVQKAALPPKYRHPSNIDFTWSGRGRQPQGVEVWLRNGGTYDALMAAAEKFDKKHRVAVA